MGVMAVLLVSCESNSLEAGNEQTYVDLGLSVKWATCNVGAKTPQDAGGYFAWGEIRTKNNYSWWTYKWCNNSPDALTKYSTDAEFASVVDKQTYLEKKDDVAAVHWGNQWRMPTRAEFQELMDSCIWLETFKVDSLYKDTVFIGLDSVLLGYTIKSLDDAYTDSLFLPAAGFKFEDSHLDLNETASYWTSTLLENSPRNAYDAGSHSRAHDRCVGRPIRPVHP